MPLDQAVLEHQVVGGVPAEEGAAPQVDVVVVAARRDMVASFVEPMRRAGLEPVGVDLSAFGMIRALADAGAGRRRASSRRSAPARPSSTATSATSPTSPSPAAAPASSPASPTPASRRSPARLAATRGLSPEHAAQWLAHVGLEQPRRGRSRATPRSSPQARAALEEGVAAPARRAAPLARLLRRPGERRAGRADRPLRPRQRDPRPRRARWKRGLGAADRRRPARRRSAASTTPPPPGSTLSYGLALESYDAPGQPDPPRAAPRRQRPAAHRPARLHRRRRPGRSSSSASPCWSSPATRSPNSKAEVAQLKREDAAAEARGAAARRLHPVPARCSEQRVATVSQPRRQPLRLGAGDARTRAGAARATSG